MRGTRLLALVVLMSGFCQPASADGPKERGAAPRSAAVRLTDNELDQVYAGGISIVEMQNPGNDNKTFTSTNHFGCVNEGCGLPPAETGANGIHIMINSGKGFMLHAIGGGL